MSQVKEDHIKKLEECELWKGSMMELTHQQGLLEYRHLVAYSTRTRKLWNNKKYGATPGEKQLSLACEAITKEVEDNAT